MRSKNLTKAERKAKQEKRSLQLNRGVDPERAKMYLGKEIVENEDEREEVPVAASTAFLRG